jgi:hypothetical protein
MAFCSTAAVLACAKGIATPAAAAEPHGKPPRPTISGFNLTPATVEPAGVPMAPATKVIASIGPASRDAPTLDALLATGMSCARLDASNARPLFWHLETYELLQVRARVGSDRP